MSFLPATEAANFIQTQVPHFQPKVGIVLGSGLNDFVSQLAEPISFSYSDIPNFPKTSVAGHQGVLTLGLLKKTPVVCLQGRVHSYEGQGFESLKTYVRTLKYLGCEYFIATNAAGSLHTDMPPGSLMLIHDHINLQGSNPLVGPNDDALGPRFLPLDNAYDKTLRLQMKQTSDALNIKLHEGVYICVTGPNYETAAEIHAFRTLGADAVGMSTVPEILVAHHCGMKTNAISVISNYATGLDSTSHSHEEVLLTAQKATKNLTSLLTEALNQLP